MSEIKDAPDKHACQIVPRQQGTNLNALGIITGHIPLAFCEKTFNLLMTDKIDLFT